MRKSDRALSDLTEAPPEVVRASWEPFRLGWNDCGSMASRFLERVTGVGWPQEMLDRWRKNKTLAEAHLSAQATDGGLKEQFRNLMMRHPHLQPFRFSLVGMQGVAVLTGRVKTFDTEFFLHEDIGACAIIDAKGRLWTHYEGGPGQVVFCSGLEQYIVCSERLFVEGRNVGNKFSRRPLLSAAECHALRLTGAGLQMEAARIGYDGEVGAVREHVRAGKVGWLHRKDHRELFERVDRAVFEMNRVAHNVDCSPEGPLTLQYGVYDEGAHFSLHRDAAFRAEATQRKLSASILLSDPDEYEGGALSIEGQQVSQEIGQLVVFPSIADHKVARVTRGRRVSLVGWYEGPAWR